MKQTRINKTLQLMHEKGIEGLLYASSANFQYLLDKKDYFWQRTCMNNINGNSNFRNVPEAVLYLRQDGQLSIFCIPSLKKVFFEYPNVNICYMDQLEDTIAPYINENKIGIGYACHDYLKEMLLAINNNVTILEAENLLNDLRCIKDESEIATLRQLALFTDEAVGFVINNLKEQMKQYEAENLIMKYGLDHNISDLSFPPTCGFKPLNSQLAKDALTFDRNTELSFNTAIAFDVGFMNNGYCSDWGRTVYFGKASQLVKDGYKALQAGQQAMVSLVKPYQTNVNELYDFVLAKTTELGYGDYLRFKDRGNLGHQIGIDCHEHPMINRETDYILKPGMVFCSEPKMFFVDECYMRVEDMILVTETGAEFLTKFDRELFEI